MEIGKGTWWGRAVRGADRRWYAEIVVIVLAMAGADALRLFPVRLADIQPHPFWVPILLSSVLYGRLLGVLTVVLAAAAQAYLGWQSLVNYPDLYSYVAEHSKEPLLWLVVASVLGGIRDKQRQKERDVEAIMRQRTIEAHTLAQRCHVLGREVALLEHRIAASGASAAGATMLALDRLREAPLSRSLEHFEQVLHRLIGAKGVSVYFLVRDQWVAAIEDPEGSEANAGADDATADLCRQVAATNRVLSCLRDSDAKVLNGRAAMATCFARNRFVGVVLVREVDPACLTSAGEAALSLACFILGSRAVLERARTIEHSSARGARRQQRLPRLRLVNDNH